MTDDQIDPALMHDGGETGADMPLEEFLEKVRSGELAVPMQAGELVARLDAAEGALETANEEIVTLKSDLEKAQAAVKKAKDKAKVATSEGTGSARKFDTKAERLESGFIRARIDAAEKVEIVFTSNGKEVIGLPPVVISGEAWSDSPNGLMLNEPVTLHGPAHGQAAFAFDGYGLLVDGKPAAYRPRIGGAAQVGTGGTLRLENDIIL